MTSYSLTVAEEARLDYAQSVNSDPVCMADYDEDALRRATYEMSVIRRRAAAESAERNGGGDYTYVNDDGHTVKVRRWQDVLQVSVVNDVSSNAYGIIRLPDSAAIGVAAAILSHAGHDHLAAALQAGVQ
ncbi:MAG: hypothetical protein ABS888_00130 [Eubacteriales bacterium]